MPMTLRPLALRCPSALVLSLLVLLASCGGGGGSSGGGGGGGGGPLPTPADFAGHSGLLAAAAGNASARVHFRLPPAGYEAALFHSATSLSVVVGSPAQSGLSGSAATVTGLPNGQDRFFALGIRPVGGSTWTQAGQILRVRPLATTIYVDGAAAPGGNGTQGAPFRDLQSGLNAASVAGAANVYVRDGFYTQGLVSPGTHLYGGFAQGAAFSLDGRAPTALLTRVQPSAGQPALDASLPGARIVIDGFSLEGQTTARYGIDHQNIDLDVRSVAIQRFADRGIRLRNTSTNENVKVQLVNCSVQQNGADGVSLNGPFELAIDASSFDANVQEGLDCGWLFALQGQTSSLRASHSRFANNGSEGVDASLDKPATATTGAGSFDVEFTSCTFVGNGLDGLLIDQEFEDLTNATQWTARMLVRDCRAANNALAGVHIDFDGLGEALVQGLRAAANGTDGLLVTSETIGGMATASGCLFEGNLGAGLRVTSGTGNKVVAASHCAFLGNQLGGMLSPARESSATNCIFRLQPTPTQNVRALGNVVETSAAVAMFANAPSAFARVTANSSGTLTLAAPTPLVAGQTVEIGDDDVELSIAQTSGTTAVLSTAPTILRLPASLSGYPSSSIADDLTLAPGAAAIGVGMTEAGAAAVDAGPLGGPIALQPGAGALIAAPLFWLMEVTPKPGTGLSSSANVSLRFSANLDAGSVTPTSLRVVDAGGNVVAAGANAALNTVTLTPPGGGWPAGALRIELHRSLAAADATTFAAPQSYPLR